MAKPLLWLSAAFWTCATDRLRRVLILLSVTEIFPRHAEVLGGFTEVIMAVAAMVMMAVVAVVTMMAVIVILIEDIIQETSEERCGKKWQHAILHCR